MTITYDRTKFFVAVRSTIFFGHMTEKQAEGTSAILDVWEAHQPAGDTRFIAYMLATANWETGHTMEPVRELGLGRGHGYGVPAGPWHEVYYGRGDVQDTWYANYAKQDPILHKLGVLKPNESLAKTPDLALRSDVAGAILLYGMLEGWFTGKKLSTYFTAHGSDWFNARRIINGTDQARIIGLMGQHFYAALEAARMAAPPSPAPAAA